MSITVWITIGIVFVVVWGAIIWEFYNTPVMPDDYDNEIKNKKNNK